MEYAIIDGFGELCCSTGLSVWVERPTADPTTWVREGRLIGDGLATGISVYGHLRNRAGERLRLRIASAQDCVGRLLFRPTGWPGERSPEDLGASS